MAKLAKALSAAAGNSSADKAYVEDVFSTFLYDGVNGVNTITNGIDLAGEGGLVWCKDRNYGNPHRLYDTERGINKYLDSASNAAEGTNTGSGTNHGIDQFNSNGFRIGGQDGSINDASSEYVSWNFRKQPGFFDIVKYTGTGSARTVAHNLGSVPGCIICKSLATADWITYHNGANNGSNAQKYFFKLNGTNAQALDNDIWDNTQPTATEFSLDTGPNANGTEYVAYLFASGADAASQIFGDDGDEAIIKCGTYTGSGAVGKTITLGFEPQWMLVKNADNTTPWVMIDNMRGMPVDGEGPRLLADQNAAEASGASFFAPRADGAEVTLQNTYVNTSGEDYIYIAIRRGPMKEPSAGTDVYTQYENNPSSVEDPFFQSSFPVDLGIFHKRTNNEGNYLTARLLGLKDLNTTTTAALGNNTNAKFDYMNGWYDTGGAQYSGYSSLMFRRYPKVFDVVCYAGAGGNADVTHNLGVAPELIIVKATDKAESWAVQAASPAYPNVAFLNNDGAFSANGQFSAAPTATVFKVANSGNTNESGYNYVAYLFATLAGVSKVGVYTGTGNTLNVDCGFSGGARFVMVKRTDSAGDWYVYDSVIQGIVAGNDPYWLMNTAAAEVTNTDYIDPLASGFTVTSNASSTINVSGGTYLFLAFA